MKVHDNPMHLSQRDVSRLQAAPRCSAAPKQSQLPCRAPAVKAGTSASATAGAAALLKGPAMVAIAMGRDHVMSTLGIATRLNSFGPPSR
jgi:hypothetical protein